MPHERIIPIQIEKSVEETKNGSDVENKIPKSMEGLTIKPKRPKVQVKQKSDIHEEYLKEFDVFEDHSKCSLPNSNIPEKIILVIDQAQDENVTPFKLNNGSYTPLSMLKRAIHVFIKLKHTINKNHEFAIVILNTNNARWYLNFSTDVRQIFNFIDKLDECEVEDTFKMNSLFEELLENISLPVMKENVSPPYLIRTILCYGRSYTLPKMELTEEIKELLQHPYFVVDVLMSHEPVDKGNNCKKIFECLQNLDKKGYSYFFPVCRDTKRLHTCFAKLLAHPLQRPYQKLQKLR